MTKLIGRSNINWYELIQTLDLKQGDVRTYGVDFYQNTDGRFDEIIQLWQHAGYDKAGTVEWINYYPGKHFDAKIIEDYSSWLGYKCIRAWVSSIRPGRYAPYHWDIDDAEEEHLKLGELTRFTTHMGISEPGHVFIVDNQVFSNQESGYTHQWSNHRAWHAGGNCGFKKKWLFNFIGVKI